jgi:hypothetical protein
VQIVLIEVFRLSEDLELQLALLHGEQVLIGLLLAGAIVVVCVPVLLYLWLWHTKVSEAKLAVAYFGVVAVLWGIFAMNPNNPTSMVSLTAFSIGFILTLPWSAVTGFLVAELSPGLGDRLFALVSVLFAAVNAVILYFIAVKLRRLIK